MGQDTDAKAKRLHEAQQFLQQPTLQQVMDAEGHANIERLEYSNVLSRLQEIVLAMQMPSVLSRGVGFDIKDHVFDPHFKDNVTEMFRDPVRNVQKECALKALTMVYKDTVFADVGVQAYEGDIDNDLIQEV